MDARRLVIGTLVGGIVVYALGYLIFILAFGSFYAANVGSATGVIRDPEIVWAVFAGSCAYAALITLMIGITGGVVTTGEAMKRGAAVGFLLWVTADFIFFGSTNVQNLTRTAVDPMLELVRGGISGGIIGVILAKVGGVRARQGRETASV
ncbi:MAG TPA: hypothetical protein VGJ78_24440 [Vicinamibacterales bacterium]|jgi:hypothetical protein